MKDEHQTFMNEFTQTLGQDLEVPILSTSPGYDEGLWTYASENQLGTHFFKPEQEKPVLKAFDEISDGSIEPDVEEDVAYKIANVNLKYYTVNRVDFIEK